MLAVLSDLWIMGIQWLFVEQVMPLRAFIPWVSTFLVIDIWTHMKAWFVHEGQIYAEHRNTATTSTRRVTFHSSSSEMVDIHPCTFLFYFSTIVFEGANYIVPPVWSLSEEGRQLSGGKPSTHNLPISPLPSPSLRDEWWVGFLMANWQWVLGCHQNWWGPCLDTTARQLKKRGKKLAPNI